MNNRILFARILAILVAAILLAGIVGFFLTTPFASAMQLTYLEGGVFSPEALHGKSGDCLADGSLGDLFPRHDGYCGTSQVVVPTETRKAKPREQQQIILVEYTPIPTQEPAPQPTEVPTEEPCVDIPFHPCPRP